MLPPPLGEGNAQLPARVAEESGGDSELMFGPPLPGAATTEGDAWLVSALVLHHIPKPGMMLPP